MFHTTMILHKSSCTADTTLCNATNVGIMVVRNVATIKTEPHQHTCISTRNVWEALSDNQLFIYM